MIRKANSKPSQTSKIELFRKLIQTTEPNSKSCQTSKVEVFVIIVKN